jgi:hypothetical protein
VLLLSLSSSSSSSLWFEERMGTVFGKEKPLKEVLRENKRMITRAIRELDREKLSLEKEEKRLTIEIKKAAKEQRMSTVKIMAKVCGLLVNYRIHTMLTGLTWSSHNCFNTNNNTWPPPLHNPTGFGPHTTIHNEIH